MFIQTKNCLQNFVQFRTQFSMCTSHFKGHSIVVELSLVKNSLLPDFNT